MEWFDKNRIPEGNWPFLLATYHSLEELEERLSNSIDLTEGTGELLITGCLEVYRQVIIRRTLDLAQAIVVSWNAGHPIGAIVCARALLETLAIFNSLLRRGEAAAAKGDWTKIGKLVDAYAFSDGSFDTMRIKESSPRLGELVKKFLKSAQPGLEQFWDQICGTAHPNGKQMLQDAGVLHDLRFDVHLSNQNESVLFVAVFNCLYSCCWLLWAMTEFDILLEQIRFGKELPKDHPLVVGKKQSNNLVKNLIPKIGRIEVGPVKTIKHNE